MSTISMAVFPEQKMDTESESKCLNIKTSKFSKLVEVEGVPLSSKTAEKWDQIQGFKARSDDLLICTYPKAGTTWIQEIVDMIHHGGDPWKCDKVPIYQRCPFIELFLPKPIFSGLELADRMPSPRLLKTHLPVHLLPHSFWEQKCKIIYLARNIKDNAVSYFHFCRMNQLTRDPGKWNHFLEDFIAGKCIYGSWSDHVSGWWKAKDHHPILYLFYEDMKEGAAWEIRKVAQFLGLELSESVLNQIVLHTAFCSMKVNPMTNYTTLPSSILDQSVSSYLRKGTVGDWKEYFTVAQSEKLDDICAQELGSSGLIFRTQLSKENGELKGTAMGGGSCSRRRWNRMDQDLADGDWSSQSSRALWARLHDVHGWLKANLSQTMNTQHTWETLDPKYIKRSKLADVQGVPLLEDTAEQWDMIWGFKTRPDDLLICTYPKAGTTWMQEIVDMIQHGGDAQKCARAPIHERMPFIELCLPKPLPSGVEEADAMPSPRTLKSHLPAHLLPPSFWEQKSKIIYVARNAKDIAVSYFYFHKMDKMMPECGNWEEFLEKFIAGKVAWGSWCDHVCGWWKAKDHHPVLYLFYEDIKEDSAREIQKIAQFLDTELSETVLNQIVKHTSFESMKANPMTNISITPNPFMDSSVSPFMRKGIVGDWKDHFTVAQRQRLDDICAQSLAGSGLTFRTQL